MTDDTSYQGVVYEHKADENIIKHSESNQQPIEGVLHLFTRQDDNGDGIAKQSKQTNWKLQYQIYNTYFI